MCGKAPPTGEVNRFKKEIKESRELDGDEESFHIAVCPECQDLIDYIDAIPDTVLLDLVGKSWLN